MLEGACLCGSVRWRVDGAVERATACNCTACRRYGALWGYGHAGEDVHVSGETRTYLRREDSRLGFHFCPTCGSLAYWLPVNADAEGRRRMGFNLRMAEPELVADIPIHHLDGLNTWTGVQRDTRCVGDLWF